MEPELIGDLIFALGKWMTARSEYERISNLEFGAIETAAAVLSDQRDEVAAKLDEYIDLKIRAAFAVRGFQY